MTLISHRPDFAFGARRKRSCGTTVATCVRRRRIEGANVEVANRGTAGFDGPLAARRE